MEEVPKDPWGQPYKYRYPAVSSKKPYDVYSVGADGQDGTPDDIGNWKAVAPK
jgi:general secretion pathway protein G